MLKMEFCNPMYNATVLVNIHYYTLYFHKSSSSSIPVSAITSLKEIVKIFIQMEAQNVWAQEKSALKN